MLKFAVVAVASLLAAPAVQGASVQDLKQQIALAQPALAAAAAEPIAAVEAETETEELVAVEADAELEEEVTRLIEAETAAQLAAEEAREQAAEAELTAEVFAEAEVAVESEALAEVETEEERKRKGHGHDAKGGKHGHGKHAHKTPLRPGELPYGIPFHYPKKLTQYDEVLEYFEQITLKLPEQWKKYYTAQLTFDALEIKAQEVAVANLDLRPKPAKNFISLTDQRKIDKQLKQAKATCDTFSKAVKAFALLPAAEQTAKLTEDMADKGKKCTTEQKKAKDMKTKALAKPILHDNKHREKVKSRLTRAKFHLKRHQISIQAQDRLHAKMVKYHDGLIVERNVLAAKEGKEAWTVGTIISHSEVSSSAAGLSTESH